MVLTSTYGRTTFRMLALVKPKKTSDVNPLKRFFVDSSNHCTRFCTRVAALDKILKTSIATAELAKAISIRTESESAITATSNCHSTLQSARSVVGLLNVFNGCIVNIVSSVKTAFKLAKGMKQKYDIIPIGEYTIKDETYKEMQYNKVACGRKEQSLALISHTCQAVGSLAFAVTFGSLRPIILANKTVPFLASHAKEDIGTASTIIMSINHVVGIIGSAANMVYESLANKRVRKAVAELRVENDTNENFIKSVRTLHNQSLVKSILTFVEKLFEFFLDLCKLICDVARVIPLEMRASLAIAVGAIGLYKIWIAS